MILAVAIATAGRPEILTETLRDLQAQTRQPDRILVCPARREDGPATETAAGAVAVEVVPAPTRGLCAQRNALLRACPDADILVFLDDDFLPAPDFLAGCEALFAGRRDVVVATGRLLADGIHGPGLSPEEGRRILRSAPSATADVEDTYGAYGCNMAIRLDAVRRAGALFDEMLPLYGWQEDIDFSRQLAPFGRVVRSQALRGVHLGAKSGRTSGVRLGYSQVANARYLIAKGTVSLPFAGKLALRNIAANLLRLLRPEPHIDRRGRLKGNLIAIVDILRGRSDPRRILDL